MIKIALIRHSKTEANLHGRYIGKTDEHLCTEGIEFIKTKVFPNVQAVYSSPLLRCMETARIIYKDLQPIIYDDLRECDFGDFENKNYKELEGNPYYQKWIDSNGVLPFPNGEDPQNFRKRSTKAFEEIIADIIERNIHTSAIVAHGGTIMAILDKYSYPHKDFYNWQVKNCGGYVIEIDEKLLSQADKKVKIASFI